MKPMALILQGGGALGAFEYGVVSKLVELGWQPTAVSGVSIGAINAAAIAGARDGDIAASLQAIWRAITLPQVPWLPASMQSGLSLLGNPQFWRSRYDYADMARWTSLCDTSPMHATLSRHCDFAQINDPAHMRFAVTATNLHTGGPTTFCNHHAVGAHTRAGNHASTRAALTPAHVLASGSLPPGFPSTVIERRHYWDGGLFSNTPIDAMLDLLEPDEIASLPIFVIDLFPTGDQPAPANLLEVQTRAIALQYQNRFWNQFGGDGRLEGFVAMLEELDKELPAHSALRHTPAFRWLNRLQALKNLRVISSAAAPAGGDHDFSPYGVRHAYQAGRAAVVRHFEQEASSVPALRAA
ncbi:MAG: patatin-like phospholipase family protein [Pseudomonadota bacterium]